MTTAPPRGQPPTAREMQVIRLAARGLTNAEIGAELGLSPVTAKKHLVRVGAKFGMDNRAGIIGAAILGGHLAVPVTGIPPAGFDEGLFDVLVRVAKGLTNQEIGAELALSIDAVKSRVSRLLTVLGVRSREEAVAAGVACGVLRLVPVRRREQVAA